MKKISKMISVSLASIFGISIATALPTSISHAESSYTANWGTHELVQQSDYELRDGATESQFISYGPSAQGKVWYSRSVANFYDLDKVTVLTSYKGYDSLLSEGTYATSTVQEQIDYLTTEKGYDVIGGINGTSFDTGNGAPAMGLMINGVEYCPNSYFSNGFFGILKNDETGDQKAIIGRTDEYAGFRDGTTVSRVENGVTVDYSGYKLWQAIGGWSSILIENGTLCSTDTWDEEHPRTAIGITADGKVVTYVCEGRNGNRAGGLSLYNMASIMEELGCVYAINLDGGGSSTSLSKHAGETTYKNRIEAAYGADRSVGDAILFVRTDSMAEEKPVRDNTFAKAHILPNNDLFVVGTTINFTATGSSAAGDPATIPDDVVWELDEEKSTAGIGSIDPVTGVFTANGTLSGHAYVNMKYNDVVVGSTKVDLTWPGWNYSQAFPTVFSLGFNEEKTLEFTLYPDAGEGNKALGISTWRPMVVQSQDLEWNVPNGCSVYVNSNGDFVLRSGDTPVVDGEVSVNKVVATGQTNVMTKKATFSVGKAPDLLYDFEDDEWTKDWWKGGRGTNLYKTTAAEGGKVLFGDSSMAIDYDFSGYNYIEGLDPSKANRPSISFYNDNQGFNPVVPADAKYFGMWVYFPEGFDGCWFRVTLQGKAADGSGSYKTAVTTMTDFVTMPKNPKVDRGIYGSGEWRFYYTEIGFDTTSGNAWSNIQGPYSIYSCLIMWSCFSDTMLGYEYFQPDSTESKELARQEIEAKFNKACTGTIYVDNVMALYGVPTDDMQRPYMDNFTPTIDLESNYCFSFNLKDFDKYDTSTPVGIKYGEITILGELQRISGLDYSSLKIYTNGELLSSDQYSVDENTGLVTISGQSSVIQSGSTLRIVIFDKMANKFDVTKTLRSISIVNNTTNISYNFWDGETVSGLTLPTPAEKEGHTFNSWSGTIPTVMPDSDIVIEALYDINKHTVTINDQDGNLVETRENVEYGTSIALPVVEGYTVTWKDITDPVLGDEDVTLVVNKVINQYTLTFTFDGQVVSSVDVDYNSVVTAPSLEGYSKVGHTFAGWDTEVPSNMPANDLTINAVFEINKHTVTINDQDGNLVETRENVEYGTSIALPVVEGYTVTWKDVTDPVLGDADVTLVVNKVINQYTLTFTFDGQVVSSVDVDYNSAITAPSLEGYSKVGYTFANWDAEVPSNMPANDLTINAVFEINKHTVTINDQNGNLVETRENVEYGSLITLPVIEGYTITWDSSVTSTVMPDSDVVLVVNKIINKYTAIINDQEGKLVTVYVDVPYGTTIALPVQEGYVFEWPAETNTTMPDHNVTLVVNKYFDQYKLTFTFDGQVVSSANVNYNSEITVPSLEGYSKVGYTFAGWDIKVPSNMPAKNLTINAVFEINKHTVTINDQDGNLVETRENVEFGTSIALPVVEGYTVTWKDVTDPVLGDADVTLVVNKVINKHTVTINDQDGNLVEKRENVEYGTPIALPVVEGYIVIWKDVSDPVLGDEDVTLVVNKLIKKYTVTINDQDGNLVETRENVEYGTAIVLPVVEGYTITWKDVTDPVLGDEDVTLVVNKVINQYTLTFTFDGQVVSSVDVDYNSAITAPSLEGYSKVGYTFVGWDAEVPSNMPAKELTFNAVFKINKHTVTINDQDGNLVETRENVEYGTSIALPVVEGYTVTWKDGKNPVLGDKDVTLVVNKVINKYIVAINDQNGTSIWYNSNVEYGTKIELPVLEGFIITWVDVENPTVPANNVTLVVNKVVDKNYATSLVISIKNAETTESKFEALKEMSKLISECSTDDKELISGLISEYEELKATYNNSVSTAKEDLSHARKVASWVIFGSSSIIVSLLSAAAVIIKRRIF